MYVLKHSSCPTGASWCVAQNYTFYILSENINAICLPPICSERDVTACIMQHKHQGDINIDSIRFDTSLAEQLCLKLKLIHLCWIDLHNQLILVLH